MVKHINIAYRAMLRKSSRPERPPVEGGAAGRGCGGAARAAAAESLPFPVGRTEAANPLPRMRMFKRLACAALFLTLAGCEPGTQRLPFDAEAPATRQIPAGGGTISTPAGAALHFPVGAFGSSTQVTLGLSPTPGQLPALGMPASPVFAVDAGGSTLRAPALLELRLLDDADRSRLWLATVVDFSGGVARAYADSRVDLTAGIVSGKIARLGWVGAVIPHAGSVFPLDRRFSLAVLPVEGGPNVAAASGAVAMTDSVSVRCGGADPACAGLTAEASGNLLDLTEEAAVLFPAIAGIFRRGALGSGSGRMDASASVRLRLKGSQTSETVVLDASLAATASTAFIETAEQITLTNVLHRISGADHGVQEEIASVVIPKAGGGGTVRIRRIFSIRNADGVIEPAEFSVAFPVTLHP
jgi:hypothetical protein